MFKEVRIECLHHWKKNTKRKRSINDNVTESIECFWQDKYVSRGKHNSIFCSFAEWNTHLTDLLCDNRLDKLRFTREKDSLALFRYYTRILLIASEILTDFQDFLVLFEEINQSKSRTKLTDSTNDFTFQELIDYINSICKHKIGQDKFHKYHFYNHHIKYHFNDSGISNNNKRINAKNVKTIVITGSESLEVPSLLSIIKHVLFAYSVVDTSLSTNYRAKKKLLRPFERKL